MNGMKALRLSRAALQAQRTRPLSLPSCTCQLRRKLIQQQWQFGRRYIATASARAEPGAEEDQDNAPLRSPGQTAQDRGERRALRQLPSPPPSECHRSARLAALHARLTLPPRFPLETLMRCLVHPSADPDSRFNNASLDILGMDLMEFFATESVMCRFPRLPTEVLFNSIDGYIGSRTLTKIRREWGVEAAAFPGGEVDPGLLQFVRQIPGNISVEGTSTQLKEMKAMSRAGTPGEDSADTSDNVLDEGSTVKSRAQQLRDLGMDFLNRPAVEKPNVDSPRYDRESTISQRILTESSNMYDDKKFPLTESSTDFGVTVESASASFVRALMGALYLHTGFRQAQAFFRAHFLSRHLDIAGIMTFRRPAADLSRLCAREGFDPPVARILSETGRKSSHPVFVVGVFSGREKLGEGSGSSLDEARMRAAISALKGWYLYSPLRPQLPSSTIGKDAASQQDWRPCMIDGGEVVV